MTRQATKHPTRRALRRVCYKAAAALIAVALAAAWASTAFTAEALKDVPGSHFTYVHRLPLMSALSEKPEAVIPKEGTPFSWRATCTKCHNYSTISTGWHFSATDTAVAPGRPGEPWFWTDTRTGTQIPVSYRAWPHTWRPDALGMTPWRFMQEFSLHLPGGGPGELADVSDPAARWMASGKLEINCAGCHSGDPSFDNIEVFLQVAANQNYLWAPAASVDFASLSGSAAKMPPSFDPSMPPEDEAAAKLAPAVTYDMTKFDSKNRAFFNLPREPLDKRCYFCHSTSYVRRAGDAPLPEVWETDPDVHTAAGLSCSTCHRHGLDHAVRRGYEGEPGSDDPALASLTCRGCHLGAQSAAAGPETMGGRLGAPVPEHKGLPTLHLQKLSCTTCHSGRYPTETAGRVQTSRAHSLEISRAPFRGDDALPLVQEPVFAHQADGGPIAPHRMVWPAFFGVLAADKVSPLSPDAVYKMGKAVFEKEIAAGKGLTPTGIAAALALIAGDKSAAGGEAVYVSGGKLYRRAADGSLAGEEHAAAQPVSWPIAHAVRPKARALGAGGCTDCHAADSPMAFGKVMAESPRGLGDAAVLPMYTFQDRDPVQLQAWAASYTFRPMFKVVGFAAAGVMGAVLLLYLLKAVAAIVRSGARSQP